MATASGHVPASSDSEATMSERLTPRSTSSDDHGAQRPSPVPSQAHPAPSPTPAAAVSGQLTAEEEGAVLAEIQVATGFRFGTTESNDARVAASSQGDGSHDDSAAAGSQHGARRRSRATEASIASMPTTEYKFGKFMTRHGVDGDGGGKTPFRRLLRDGMRDRIVAGEPIGSDEPPGSGQVDFQDDSDFDSATGSEDGEGYDNFDSAGSESGFAEQPGEALAQVTMSNSGAHRASVSSNSSGDSDSTAARLAARRRSSVASYRSRRRRSRRSSRASRVPAVPVGVFWGKKNVHASTQPPMLPATEHHLVLRTLISALRAQLVPDDSIPTIFQPPVGRIDDQFYPDSVKQEHEEYFYNAKLKQLEDVDKKFKRTYLQDATVKVEPAYPFDRQVSRKPSLPKRKQQKAVMKGGKPSHSWVELHTHADTQKRLRVEHMLALLTQEQVHEIQREKDILMASREDRAAVTERVEQERAEAADWMMRIAEDYSIVSSLTAGEYLHSTIEAAGKAKDADVVKRQAQRTQLEDELEELKTYKRQPLAELYKTIPKTGFTKGYSIGELGPANVAAAMQSRWYTTKPIACPPKPPREVAGFITPQLELGQGTWFATGTQPRSAGSDQGPSRSTRRTSGMSRCSSRTATVRSAGAASTSQRSGSRRSRLELAHSAYGRSPSPLGATGGRATGGRATGGRGSGQMRRHRPAHVTHTHPKFPWKQDPDASLLSSLDQPPDGGSDGGQGGGRDDDASTVSMPGSFASDGPPSGRLSYGQRSQMMASVTMPSLRRSTRGRSSRRKTGRVNGATSTKRTLRSTTGGTSSAATFTPKARLADHFATKALTLSNTMTRDRMRAERSIPKHSHAVWDTVASHPRLRPMKRSEHIPADTVGNHHRDEWNGNVILMQRMTNSASDAKRYSYLTGRRCL